MRESQDHHQEDDIVTRIQTNLDQLATQFYASVSEATGLPLRSNDRQVHTPGAPTTPVPTLNATETDTAGQEGRSKKDKKDKSSKDDGEGPEPAAKPPLSPGWTPLEPESFDLDIAELADDLVTKQKQIEELMNQLPHDLEQEEARQDERIRALIRELEALESGVGDARRERDLLLNKIEGVIEGIGRRGGG